VRPNSPEKKQSGKISYFAFTVTTLILSVWILSNISSITTAPKQAQVSSSPDETPAVSPTFNATPSPLAPMADSEPLPQFLPTPTASFVFKKEIIAKLESSSKLSSVCESISKMDRKQNEPIPMEKLSERFEDSVFDRSADPTFESLKPILKYVLRKPALRGLVFQKDDSNPSQSTSDQIYEKYKALADNRSQLESIMDQSYLLLMLGRSVDVKPELASDPDVENYCYAIEAKLNNLSKVDFGAQKQAFGEFLKIAGIDPGLIGFDPGYKTDLHIEMDGTSYSYNLGWIRLLWASN
jgi:hypothetical protein